MLGELHEWRLSEKGVQLIFRGRDGTGNKKQIYTKGAGSAVAWSKREGNREKKRKMKKEGRLMLLHRFGRPWKTDLAVLKKETQYHQSYPKKKEDPKKDGGQANGRLTRSLNQKKDKNEYVRRKWVVRLVLGREISRAGAWTKRGVPWVLIIGCLSRKLCT